MIPARTNFVGKYFSELTDEMLCVLIKEVVNWKENGASIKKSCPEMLKAAQHFHKGGVAGQWYVIVADGALYEAARRYFNERA